MKKNSGFLRFLVQCFFILAVAFITTACGGGGGAFVSSGPPGDDLGGVNPAQMQELLHAEPTSIGDVTAAISDDAKVIISWVDTSQSEDGFDILKDGNKVATVARNVSSWTDAEATNGERVCYQVVAYNKEWKTFSEKKCFSIFMPNIFVMPAFVVERCDQIRGGASFGGKTYLIWFKSNSLCIGPEKSYLSVFSSDEADAVEEVKVELNMSFPSSIAINEGVIYIGGSLANMGALAALNQNDLTVRWELKLSDLEFDFLHPSSIHGIAVDQNNVFVTGDIFFGGDHAEDIITVRFDLDGNYIWSEYWGASCFDWGEYVIASNGGIDVHAKAGQYCMIMSPDTPTPEYQGDVVLHYDYE